MCVGEGLAGAKGSEPDRSAPPAAPFRGENEQRRSASRQDLSAPRGKPQRRCWLVGGDSTISLAASITTGLFQTLPKLKANMAPFEKSMEMMPFKQRKCLATRKDEVCSIRSKFPNKLPVIVERYIREKTLPLLDKTKFLVPFELTLGQFLCLLRNKIALDSSQTLFLLVAEKSMSCMSSSMGDIYSHHRDADGFLYITYASQEVFGAPQLAARLPG
uniref:Microtubule-associated protein 1 light chain 3 gamma, like n=6 Tax=Nothobranchius TaxID=28779 RepID=A0A8C6NL36_NOTFU